MDPLQNTRMFEIPFWSLKCTDWENKKRQFKDVLKTYPGVREGAQTFLSNRNTNLEGLTDCFLNLFREEMTRISHNFKRDLAVLDSWSVTYETGDYHAPHNRRKNIQRFRRKSPINGHVSNYGKWRCSRRQGR